MKINFIKKTLLLFALSLAIISCDHDDQQGYSKQIPTNPNVAIDLGFDNPILFEEGDGETTFEYTVTLSEVQIVDVLLYVTQIGGDADEEDFEMTTLIVIPAGYTTGDGSITIFGDEIIEGDETIKIQIADQRTTNSTFTPVIVDVNIIDYVFCFWQLDTRDTYGDGWNGGYIRLETEGNITDYWADGAQSIFDIAITDGADYTFTYVSGGGTGGTPGWESENYYLLTAPDGTTWEDGTTDYSGIPTPGEITAGTNVCD